MKCHFTWNEDCPRSVTFQEGTHADRAISQPATTSERAQEKVHWELPHTHKIRPSPLLRPPPLVGWVAEGLENASMEAQCSHSPFVGSSRCLRLPTRLSVQRIAPQTRCAAQQNYTPRVNELGKESRVGKAPIPIPKGVNLTLTRDHLKVKVMLPPPRGQSTLVLPAC